VNQPVCKRDQNNFDWTDTFKASVDTIVGAGSESIDIPSAECFPRARGEFLLRFHHLEPKED